MQKDGKQNIIIEYLKNWLFLVFVLIIVPIFLLAYFLNTEIFKKDMLFWFFSATSQSMAALFAVIGMFLVFRYQDLQNRLEHHIQILRNNFMSSDWSQFFGYNYSHEYINCLTDSELLSKAQQFLKKKEKESQDKAYNNLEVSLLVIKRHIHVRDNIILSAKVPMVAILITFLISVISLLFVDLYFSLCFINSLGLSIVLTTLVLILFSLTSILQYFLVSTRVRQVEKRYSNP